MDTTLLENYSTIFYLILFYLNLKCVDGNCLKNDLSPDYNDEDLERVIWNKKRLFRDNFNYGLINDNITLGVYQSRESVITLYKAYCDQLSTSPVQDVDTKLDGLCYRSLRSNITRLKPTVDQSYLFLSMLDNALKKFHMFTYFCDSKTNIKPNNSVYSNKGYEWIYTRLKTMCKTLTSYDKYNGRHDTQKIICFGFWIYTSNFAGTIRNLITVNLCVSVLCLFVTIGVYILLPDLRRNTYGKCIVLYLISYILSISVNLVRHSFYDDVKAVCHGLSFMMQFAALNRLSWQSVMCYDILQAFSRMKNPRDGHGSDRKKIIWYSVYAYGFPGVITLITVIMQYSSILSDGNPWKPMLRDERCYFQINYQRERKYQWLYFYGFYCGLFFVNCVMFVATSVLLFMQSKAAKSYNGSFRRNISSKQEKSMVLVHIKLFFLMGCNWIVAIMTVVMGEVETKRSSSKNWPMHFADYFTSIMPQFFFLILVCTSETTRKLKARCMELYARKDIQIATDDDPGNGSRVTVTTLL